MTNVEKLLVCLVSGYQDLVDVIAACGLGRQIDAAAGVQLDVLGKLVGISRPSDDDEVYRRYIRTKIAINRSRGTTLDVRSVVRLALGSTYDYPASVVEIHTTGIAAFELIIHGAPVDDDLAQLVYNFVDKARAAGVRFTLTYSPLDEGETAAFDDEDIGFDDADFGFGGTL